MTEVAILLTGFEPFGGEPVNPAEQLVRALGAGPRLHPRLRLATAILPVDRVRLPGALDAALVASAPAAVVCVGQATGRPRVDLECRAHNALDFGTATDNGGHRATGEALVTGGPETLDASLPFADVLPALRAAGHAVGLSTDAGRHLCNALLYDLLHRHAPRPAGFVHVPLLPEQAQSRDRSEPSLALEDSRRCVADLLVALTDRLLDADT